MRAAGRLQSKRWRSGFEKTPDKRERREGIYQAGHFGFNGFAHLLGMYGLWRCAKRPAFPDDRPGPFRRDYKKGLELGIYFFDTAIAYQSGTSEQYVGLAMRDFAKREDVAVATKFCRARRRKYSRASPADSILNG